MGLDKIIQIVLILVAGLGVYWLMNWLLRQFMNQLSDKLYKEADGQAYLDSLNSWKGKLFFKENTRQLMSVDAYLMLGKETEVQEIFEHLNQAKLNPGNQLGLFQKEISYYVSANQKEKAEQAYENLKAVAAKFKNPAQLESIVKECTYLIEVNIRHNTDYLQEMLDVSSKMKNSFYQGIFLYRAAKLYYYKGELETCRKTLLEAKEKVKGSAWEVMINQMLEDNLDLIADR